MKAIYIPFSLGIYYVSADDPSRAVKSSLEIYEKLKEIGCYSSMGIGTGTSFCGTVGSLKRCEYAIVGDKVWN
jgi:hypothetical protein